MKLAVVTHTNIEWKRDLSIVRASVAAALPSGAEHIIIETNNNNTDFTGARIDAMQLADYVVFVDDDDFVPVDSISAALEAIEETDAGIAYTRETIVKYGKEILGTPALTYEAALISPASIHHLCIYNTKYVTERSFELARRLNHSAEWIMKLDAMSLAGAVYVPINGYYWVQSDIQHHKHTIDIAAVKKEITNWQFRSGKIPQRKTAKYRNEVIHDSSNSK